MSDDELELDKKERDGEMVLFLKLFLRKFFSLDSFCKHCGRKVHDFIVEDSVWEQVEPHIKFGHILCYDCFCEVCKKIGLPAVWRLVSPRVKKLNE